MAKKDFLLLTGRTIYQGVGKEKGKSSEEYLNSVAVCEIDYNDMKLMKINENTNIKVETRHGSVIVKAVRSLRSPHQKIIFMPYGPWANLVMNSETNSTGMPSFKGLSANIEAAPKSRILTVIEILSEVYEK